MLGELYGFVRSGSVNVDCLAPLEHFEPANPVVNKQYLIGSLSYDLLGAELNFSVNYNLAYYTPSITVTGTIPSFLTIKGTQITVN
jgi:hypothetical protein